MQYRDERDLDTVMNLVDNELSEPYSVFTYRYWMISVDSSSLYVCTSQDCTTNPARGQPCIAALHWDALCKRC